MNSTVTATTTLRTNWLSWALLSLGMMAVGALTCYGVIRLLGEASPAPGKVEAAESDSKEATESAVVHMAEEKWEKIGIRLAAADYSQFSERVWRSGRLALNENRIAHISPNVEGLVREVKVRLGQEVQAGEVLVVLDSREVGQAKLDLVKARLAAEYARTQHGWTQTTSRAAIELVKAMASGTTIEEIEKRFKDRPIGDLRQQLMTAYSRWLQTKAHYEAARQPDVQGAMPQATVIRLKAEFEAAQASYRALCEEVNFQANQQVRASEQRLRETQTAEELSKSALLMLGYTREEVQAMDPIAEGGRVSLYPVRAPFAGTVIEQHAVRAERVNSQMQMFQIADLSTLWLKADVPPRDLSLVRGMSGGKLRFRVSEETGIEYEAEVFYTGDVVDKDSRTVVLNASAPNPNRTLKPGMYVEVELSSAGSAVVQVPAGAIQRLGKQAFVFVHAGGDEFRKVDVKLGRTSRGVVEVIEGLRQGQSVVVSGGFVLKSEMLKELMAGD